MFKENKLFFCHEFMSGNVINNVFTYLQLKCLVSKSPDLIETILLGTYNITPNWIANCLRPFFCEDIESNEFQKKLSFEKN